jgi:hypothetical protein
MSAQRARYLGELQLLAPVRKIINSQEWAFLVESNNIASDDDLIEFMHGALSSITNGHYQDAKARALMGVIYLTGRIIGTCELLRETIPTNILERDLGISLELPGETVNGLSFKWPKNHNQTEDLDLAVSRYTTLINEVLAKYPSSLSMARDHTLALSLLSLSSLYSVLADLVINDLSTN